MSKWGSFYTLTLNMYVHYHLSFHPLFIHAVM